jgi:hypothetical protein
MYILDNLFLFSHFFVLNNLNHFVLTVLYNVGIFVFCLVFWIAKALYTYGLASLYRDSPYQ